MLSKREQDLHLKVVCITARLMSDLHYDDADVRAAYRSQIDDQIESLTPDVIDLLAKHLKVEELYDSTDLNR